MIEFVCGCGKKIRVADEHAGKKGKCPACKNIVKVPMPMPDLASQPVTVSESLPTAESADNLLAGLLEQSYSQQQDNVMSAARREYELSKDADERPAGTIFNGDLNSPIKKKKDMTHAQKRKLPFFVDVFLFPISLAGIIQIIVYVIAMFLMKFVPIMSPVMLMAMCIVLFVINGYMYWYLCECIRDSAVGAIRSPDTITNWPDTSEAVAEFRRILFQGILFTVPITTYRIVVGQNDAIFWILAGGIFLFYPISLLAVVMYGYLSVMNPIFLVRSILRVPASYIAAIVVFWAMVVLSQYLRFLMGGAIALGLLGSAVAMYMMLIAGHILGRFYFNNSEKLDWEV